MQPQKRSLTVAGQWRIFTALPEHPTSELLLCWFNHRQISSLAWHFLKTSRRIATLQDLKGAGACPRNRNTNPVVGNQQLFTGSLCRKNRYRRSLRESIRIDVNLVGLLARASLDRSNLPSALLHQWRAHLDPLRLQWLGRSGVKPDSHTTPSHKFYTGSKGC